MSDPKISVVIATLNSAAVLQGALRSLAEQESRDFEVIIADGASKDVTLAVAESFRMMLPHLLIDSQKDGGVYEAINRGVELARGGWVYVLGSDDELSAMNVFSRASAALESSQADLVYGDVRMMGPNRWVADGARYAGEVDIAFLSASNICQQAIFYRRTTLIASGLFDARYRICADWVFLLRAFGRLRIEWTDLEICRYATSGLSSQRRDEALSADFLDILGETIARDAFSLDLLPIRYKVHECAAAAADRGKRGRALLLHLAFFWLRACNYGRSRKIFG